MKEQVREANDIVEVVQEFMELKRRGKNWTGLCPFHEEEHASFTVFPERQSYYCFSCGEFGDVFNFIQLYKNFTFPQALEYLTRRAEINPSSEKSISRSKKKILPKKDFTPVEYKKMEERIEEYQGKIPQEIKEARGLSDEVIEIYKIGYTSRHWKTSAELYKDHRDCITIPVTKEKKLVNIRYHTTIKGKKIKDLPYDTGLEYATWLYPEEQLNNETLIFTEGELDALCCISHGIPAITRTCGAITWKPEFTDHFRHKTIYIIQDCDPAGQKGALRIAQELLGIAKEIKIIELGLRNKGDLTDWFVTYGKTKEELRKLIDQTPAYLGEEEKKERSERIFITGRQLVEEEVVELPAPIRNGFVVPERYTILAASDGEGKTTFCTQLALSAITGTTLLSFFPIPKAAKVLYFCGENSRGDIKAKVEFHKTEIEKILNRSILKELEENFFLVEPININFCLSPKDKTELHGWLEDVRPDIVIFDPLADFISSQKSLSDDALARGTVKTLTELAQKYKCFPIITTHLKKEAINQQTGRSIVTLDNCWDFVHGSKYWLNSAAAQIVMIRANLQRYPKAKRLVFKFKTVTGVEPMQILRNENLWYEELPSDKMSLASLTSQDVKRVLQRRCKGQQIETLLVEAMKNDFGCGVTMAKELIKTALKTKILYKDKKDNLIKITSTVEKEIFND